MVCLFAWYLRAREKSVKRLLFRGVNVALLIHGTLEQSFERVQ